MTDLLFQRRRIGRFQVDVSFIDTGAFPDLCKNLGITVVRAEMLYHRMVIEYLCVCPSFDLLPEGEETPLYDIVAHNNEGEITYSVNRVGLTMDI